MTTDETTTTEDGDAVEAVNEETSDAEDTTEEPDGEDTFPREYVEKLRDEAARYRQRAGRVDEISERLHRLLVERTGRLADPTDLEFDEAHLDDADALDAAIDALLDRKPHLAARTPRGDVGQGKPDNSPVNLGALLRQAAR